MRPGSLRPSLASRIIVVSRKPHGRAPSRARLARHCALPPASMETISDVVDFLTCHAVYHRQSFLYQAVSSLAASQDLGRVSETQLARLYELVSACKGAGGETGACGEEGRGGMERRERVPGELGEIEEEESRVICLSALVSSLASRPSLHHMSLSALCEVLEKRGGLSPDTEQALLQVCAENHLKLLQLAQLARARGHRFSRSFYREALTAVLQRESSSDGPGPGEAGREVEKGCSVAGELMAMMSGDWERTVVETEVFWVALHLAREESQVLAIWDEMATSHYVADESVTVELVRACLRTAGKLRQSHSCRHSSIDPSHTVSTLVSRLPSRQASISAPAFERVFIACADSLQLGMAYQAFSCMTHTHGLASTRPGLQGLARLLCAPALTAKRQWWRVRLAFATRILGASVAVFDGAAPGWVFAEWARPFTELLGTRGYHLMYNLCNAAVKRDYGERDSYIIMEELWGRGLYHALLQSCRVNHGPQLAIFLLNHMTSRGIVPNERTFRHLLKFSMSPADIGGYVAVLMRHLYSLSSAEMDRLVQPLQSLLQCTLPLNRNDSDSAAVIEHSVSELLEVVSAGTTEEECVSQLASLSGVSSLPSSLLQPGSHASDCHSTSWDCLQNRAMA